MKSFHKREPKALPGQSSAGAGWFLCGWLFVTQERKHRECARSLRPEQNEGTKCVQQEVIQLWLPTREVMN